MADEHVLRIEFQGDDDRPRGDGTHGSESRELIRSDEGSRGLSLQERMEEGWQREERQRAYYEAARDRIVGATVSGGHSGPTGSAPEMEWVDETPTFSSSRALALYDPELAALGAGPAGGTTSAYGAGPTATSGMGVAAGAGGVGGGAAAGGAGGVGAEVGGAAATTAAGFGVAEVFGALGIVVGAAAVGLGIFAAMTVLAADVFEELTTAVMEFTDGLTAEFEEVNPALAAARAEQEVALIQARMGADVSGSAQLIKQETEAEIAIIQIREQMLKLIGPALQLGLSLMTKALGIAEWGLEILVSIEKSLLKIGIMATDLATNIPFVGGVAQSAKETLEKMYKTMSEEPGDDDPKTKFMRECETFLANMTSGKQQTFRHQHARDRGRDHHNGNISRSRRHMN